MTRKKIYSDLPIPPGEYLAEVLRTKGTSQRDLALCLGRPIREIDEIIIGKKAIGPETALRLESALEVPAYLWICLEKEYKIIKAR